MRYTVAAALLGLTLATPAAAQAPNVQQLLGGLLTGNQSQDQAIRDAFERGYQRGRQDEAQRAEGGGARRYDRRRDEDGQGYDQPRSRRDER